MAKVMVCAERLLTGNDCVTGVAAPKLASPDWVAVTTHVPFAIAVMVGGVAALSTVQTPRVDDVNVTGRLELAVAAELNGVLLGDFVPGLLKVMVCAAAA